MKLEEYQKDINKRIKENTAQHELYSTLAEKSALSSGNIDKYEALTGEDIVKQDPLALTRFQYTPLGKAFEKQTGVIEEKTDEQLAMIKS